ncbi:MAG: hypothetical protein KC502_00785 [Myxococcales bacterium]|nr:hypothetical protein [Myxococcales bacterium]
MNAEQFWTLKRTLAPKKLFEEVIEALPVPLPPVTVDQPVNVHILGSGGGVWALQLVDGHTQVTPGAAPNAICQVAFHKRHLREIVGGALRERGLTLMARLGKARQIPDLSRLPLDPARALSCAHLTGSIAIDVHDRGFSDTYRYVVTFGSGAPDYETATTTLTIDADEPIEWVVNRIAPKAVLKAKGVRIAGDVALPLKVVQALIG